MNIGNRLKRFGIEQTFKFVYKDPEPNLRKLMDWADGLQKVRCRPREKPYVKRSRTRTIRSMNTSCICSGIWIRE